MSDQSEIEKAIDFKRDNVAILHCMSSYPTMNKDANLINIEYLKKRHKVTTGYSDHVPGVNASINAALGAEIIEKHFMPKKTVLAGDYLLSVDKEKLKSMIIKIEELSEMIVRTKTYDCEKYSKKTLRRSLYFSKNLRKGDKIKREDLMTLRPYHPNAVKIEDLNLIIGCKLKKYKKRSSS